MRANHWVAFGAIVFAGCASAHPPPRWVEGGAALAIPQAQWDRDGSSVQILGDGRVLVDGDHWFSLDVAGRVYEPDNDPIAILEPDGQLVGQNGVLLGSIGLRNAALPGRPVAWMTISEQGAVVRYDADGDPHPAGAWAGCGPAVRTCTVVTHMVALLEERRRPHFGVGVGFGVMFGR